MFVIFVFPWMYRVLRYHRWFHLAFIFVQVYLIFCELISLLPTQRSTVYSYLILEFLLYLSRRIILKPMVGRFLLQKLRNSHTSTSSELYELVE